MAKKKTNQTEDVTAPGGVVTAPVENVQEAEAKAKQEAEAKAKQEAEAKAQQEAEAKAKEGVFVHNGIKYGFTKRTPARLQTEEGLFTQKEILSNQELMQSLIDSNCVFITQL